MATRIWNGFWALVGWIFVGVVLLDFIAALGLPFGWSGLYCAMQRCYP